MNIVRVSVYEEIKKPSWLKKIKKFIFNVLDEMNFKNQEYSVFFCNDETIKNLNSEFRKIDSATDVLSFENGAKYFVRGVEYTVMGDIVISLDTLPVNAEYFKVSQNEELKRLLIHGILHLNGMDHGEEHVEQGVEPVCEMLKIQKKLMQKFSGVVLIK